MGGVQVKATDPSKYINDDPKRRLPPGNEIPDFVIVIKKIKSTSVVMNFNLSSLPVTTPKNRYLKQNKKNQTTMNANPPAAIRRANETIIKQTRPDRTRRRYDLKSQLKMSKLCWVSSGNQIKRVYFF